MKKSSLIFLAIFIALGIYVFFDKGKKDEKKEIKHISINRDNIQKFEIKFSEGKLAVICEKNQEGIWNITEPKRYETDADSVNSVLNNLSSPYINRKLTNKASNLADYGLLAPKVSNKVTLKDKTIRTILIGDKAPSGDLYYIKEAEKNPIYTLSTFSASHLMKNLKDLRKKTIMEFEIDKVKKIILEKKLVSKVKGKIIFAKDEKGGTWQIKSPIKAKGNSSTIEELLRDIRYSLNASDFPDDNPSDFSVYGLDKPEIILSLIEDNTRKLFISKEIDNNIYVKRDDSPQIYKVRSYSIEKLRKPIEHFKEK